MKWLSALLLCVVVCAVSGELINVLHQLQESDTFHQLSVQDKIYLTDIIAASETCKLTALVNDIGRDTVVRVVSHLPDVEKQKIQTYLTNHKNAEADGTCVVQ